MTADEAIKIVNIRAAGRTRYEGCEPWLDEVLVAEIERLRGLLRECLSDYGSPRFTDRYNMADRIRQALAAKEARR